MFGSSLWAAAALAVLPASPLPPGNYSRSVMIGAESRTYLIHLPPSYDPNVPTPVVLAFHSAAMNGSAMAKQTGLNDTADRHGFVTVYPNGTGTTSLFLYWDAGGVRGKPSDDVGFVSRLLDDLGTVVNVDSKRVFATGMSNGGMLCYRLAAELSERVAAIAPVAGTMALEEWRPKRPVSVLHFHGTKDGIVLYHGPDEHIPKNLKFLSVDDTIGAWVRADDCPARPVVEELPDRAHDGTRVRRERYGPGKEGAEVVLYVIEGGGHTWPGREPPVRLLGKSTHDISANELIWEFFQRHPMK